MTGVGIALFKYLRSMKIIILLFLICGFWYCSTECLAQPRPQKEEDSLGSDTSDPNGMWGSARIGWINSDLFAGKTMRQYYGGSEAIWV